MCSAASVRSTVAAVRTVVAALLLAACGERNTGNGAEQEQQLPPESTLCELTIGYISGGEAIEGNEVLGTYRDDVVAVLGEPTKRTSDTSWEYDWCIGDSCQKTATAVLTFEKIDRCYDDTGKPVTPPYWLRGVDVTGFTRPSCWVVGSEKANACPECLNTASVGACK